MYIFLNNRILITLKLQLEFLRQNTRHCVFSRSLKVNSCKGNFTNDSGLLIGTTNLYCENMICLNLTHTLPGRRPIYFVTFSTNTKLRFEIFLCFLYFYLHEIIGINFQSNTRVSVIFVCDFAARLTLIYQSVCCYPQKTFLHKHHCENSEPLISIFLYEKLFI